MKARPPCPRTSRMLALALAVTVLAGCSSVVHGSGTTSAPTSGASSGGPSALTPDAKFPRTPIDTAIGDPASADLCGAIDLTAFKQLSGYTASFADIFMPPACTVVLNQGSTTALTVYVYGVLQHTFDHQAPKLNLARVPVYTHKIDGLVVNEFGFQAMPLGDCKRSVLTHEIIMRIQVYSRAAPGKASRSLDCGAADILTKQVASFASKRSVGRLALADPSLAGLDFCAALRAVDLSGLPKFKDGNIVPDGSGCDVKIDDSFLFYLEFAITGPAKPGNAPLITVGGHHIYASRKNDGTHNCTFTAAQGTTPKGFHEQVIANVGDYSTNGTTGLCTDTAKVFTEFLDVAGLK